MPEPAPISVLYIDDEQALLDLTRTYLERMGDFSVTPTLSVGEALGLLREGRFDIIISDYQMPEMDGIEFLKTVKGLYPEIPFILFTGRGREEVVIQAINNGAASYLQKGIDTAARYTELAHRVRQAVAAARTREALQANYAALQQQEQIIREREKYYRAVFENTGTAMIVIDADTTISLANGECERLSGFSRADVEGKMHWTDFVPAGELPRMMAWHRLRREDSTKAPRNYEFPMIDHAGNVRTIYLTIDLIPGTSKSIASLNDITDRVRAEEALRQSEALHRTIFETSPDPITLADADGIIRYASRSAIRLFGLSFEKDAIGTPLFDWIVPEMRDEVTRRVLAFIRNASPPAPPHLFGLQKKDGTRFNAEISSSVLTGPDGKPNGMISVIRDVTERIETENALRQASAKLNLLSTVTRHDILNRLTVLLNYVELAQNMKDPVTVQEYLDKIDEIGRMLEHQVRFAMDYQELGMHNPLWQGVSAIISRASAGLDMGTVRIADDCGALEVFADPMFAKVVYNLIDNAIRHGGHVTTIRAGYRTSGDDIVLIFEDDGDGVSPEDKGKIFSKGFGRNTGFGLFLVREILAITGMSVTETGIPGKGARFEVTVPGGNFRFRNAS